MNTTRTKINPKIWDKHKQVTRTYPQINHFPRWKWFKRQRWHKKCSKDSSDITKGDQTKTKSRKQSFEKDRTEERKTQTKKGKTTSWKEMIETINLALVAQLVNVILWFVFFLVSGSFSFSCFFFFFFIIIIIIIIFFFFFFFCLLCFSLFVVFLLFFLLSFFSCSSYSSYSSYSLFGGGAIFVFICFFFSFFLFFRSLAAEIAWKIVVWRLFPKGLTKIGVPQAVFSSKAVNTRKRYENSGFVLTHQKAQKSPKPRQKSVLEKKPFFRPPQTCPKIANYTTFSTGDTKEPPKRSKKRAHKTIQKTPPKIAKCTQRIHISKTKSRWNPYKGSSTTHGQDFNAYARPGF